MISSRPHGGLIIFFSFIAALMLTVMPLPVWAQPYRPEWVTLVLIYWCIALPHRIGVGIGWGVGLLLDVARDTLLGQHALSLALVAYVALKLHRRIRVAPVWQQAISVLVLVATEQMISLWVKGIIGQSPWSVNYWLPSFVSMLIWPLMFGILRGVRRRYVTNQLLRR